MELYVVDGPSGKPTSPPFYQTLEEALSYKVAEIKAEAERRIIALDWRLQRAQEREVLGEVGVESSSDVLRLREDIRQASNSAEKVVITFSDIQDVVDFSW